MSQEAEDKLLNLEISQGQPEQICPEPLSVLQGDGIGLKPARCAILLIWHHSWLSQPTAITENLPVWLPRVALYPVRSWKSFWQHQAGLKEQNSVCWWTCFNNFIAVNLLWTTRWTERLGCCSMIQLKTFLKAFYLSQYIPSESV